MSLFLASNPTKRRERFLSEICPSMYWMSLFFPFFIEDMFTIFPSIESEWPSATSLTGIVLPGTIFFVLLGQCCNITVWQSLQKRRNQLAGIYTGVRQYSNKDSLYWTFWWPHSQMMLETLRLVHSVLKC